MNLYQLMSDSPYLSFFLACVLVHAVASLANRVIRCINILSRGWPPVHLDADGDFQPRPTQD